MGFYNADMVRSWNKYVVLSYSINLRVILLQVPSDVIPLDLIEDDCIPATING